MHSHSHTYTHTHTHHSATTSGGTGTGTPPSAARAQAVAQAQASTSPGVATKQDYDEAVARVSEFAGDMFELFSTWDEYQPVMAYASLVKQSEEVLLRISNMESEFGSGAAADDVELSKERVKAMRIHALRVVMAFCKSQVVVLSSKEKEALRRKVDRCLDSKAAAALIKEGYQGLKKVA